MTIFFLVNYNASFHENLPSGSVDEPCVIEVDRLTNITYSSIDGFAWSFDSTKIALLSRGEGN